MIELEFYLSDPANIPQAQDLTGLSEDEIESVVGRFGRQSHRCGALRGKLQLKVDGEVVIRHHFNNKVLWRRRTHEQRF